MIHAPPAVQPVLNALKSQPQGRKLARSLAASRFVDFPNNDKDTDWRRRTSTAIQHGSTQPGGKLQSWRAFALHLAGPDGEKSPRLLFARQMSRLMVGMAGGVFENGGLTLDRLSGLPFIPGSAVKGCARRLALAALQEWTSGQLTPGDPENLLAPAIEGIAAPADLLESIALVFGWSDLEWQGREDFRSDKDWELKRPDFAWACGADWPAIRREVSTRLCTHLHITPKKEHADTPWKSLPHFAGAIAFLPAHPWEKDPGIDLDVVTCHHRDYYDRKPGYADAPDTEEPVPVIFPAVRPGQTWAFLLQPTPRALDPHLPLARRWLALGLETFGIGAKTRAGYGWFDASEDFQREFTEAQANKRKREAEEQERVRLEEKRKAEEEERRRKAEALKEATKDMTPEQKADYELAQLSSEQFRGRLDQFVKRDALEQQAIVRALRLEETDSNSRRTFWSELKVRAQKGGKPAQIEQAIRQLSKQMNLGKMP